MKEPLIVSFVAIVGSIGIIRAVSTGEMNLGGGRTSDFYVSYAQDPGLFSFGIVLMAVVVGLCVLYLWRRFRN